MYVSLVTAYKENIYLHHLNNARPETNLVMLLIVMSLDIKKITSLL